MRILHSLYLQRKKPSTNDNDPVFELPPQEESTDEEAVGETSVETNKNDSGSNNNA